MSRSVSTVLFHGQRPWNSTVLTDDSLIQSETCSHENIFPFNNQTDALIIQIYSVIKLYMFRASSLPIIRSSVLYIRHWKFSCMF